jgi:hypothetical protein
MKGIPSEIDGNINIAWMLRPISAEVKVIPTESDDEDLVDLNGQIGDFKKVKGKALTYDEVLHQIVFYGEKQFS